MTPLTRLFLSLGALAITFFLVQSQPTTSDSTTSTPIICTTPMCPWPTCTFHEENNTYVCVTDQSYLGCKCDPYVCTTPNDCPPIDIYCGPKNASNPPYCGCPGCFFPPPPPPPTKGTTKD